jgi:hypothetical protein
MLNGTIHFYFSSEPPRSSKAVFYFIARCTIARALFTFKKCSASRKKLEVATKNHLPYANYLILLC